MKMQNNTVFGINKNSYLTDSEIERLYREKIEALSDNEKEIKNKLFKASLYDPRRTDIYFGSEEAANKAQQVGDKLHLMTKEDFMSGDYPYKWIDELAGESIFRIINKKVLSTKD